MIYIVQIMSCAAPRMHLPYRNSMMTSVLRDSLGGNCKTSMIATMNPDRKQAPQHTPRWFIKNNIMYMYYK